MIPTKRLIVTWYWGLCFGVAYYEGDLLIDIGPMQLAWRVAA